MNETLLVLAVVCAIFVLFGIIQRQEKRNQDILYPLFQNIYVLFEVDRDLLTVEYIPETVEGYFIETLRIFYEQNFILIERSNGLITNLSINEQGYPTNVGSKIKNVIEYLIASAP